MIPDHVAWLERLARRPTTDRFRHLRRRVRFVLLVNAMLVPVAAWVALSRPSKQPPPIDILICHACASALVAAIGKALVEVLVLAKRGRRSRLSFGLVVHMLAVWPLTFAAIMVVRELAR